MIWPQVSFFLRWHSPSALGVSSWWSDDCLSLVAVTQQNSVFQVLPRTSSQLTGPEDPVSPGTLLSSDSNHTPQTSLTILWCLQCYLIARDYELLQAQPSASFKPLHYQAVLGFWKELKGWVTGRNWVVHGNIKLIYKLYRIILSVWKHLNTKYGYKNPGLWLSFLFFAKPPAHTPAEYLSSQVWR